MKKFLRKTKVRELLIMIIVIFLISSCSRKPIVETSEEATLTQEEIVAPQTEVEVSEEFTKEETTEEEVSEEEIPEEEELIELSSCVVLPEAFCEGGEPICGYEDFLPIGFNVPPGTEIRSPFNGLLTIGDMILEDGKTMAKIISVTMWPIEEVLLTFDFRDVIPEEALQENKTIQFKWGEMVKGDIIEEMIVVEKGEVIGQTTEEFPSTWGGKKYNLQIWIAVTKDLPPYTFEPESFSQYFIDVDLIRQYFPYIKECEE